MAAVCCCAVASDLTSRAEQDEDRGDSEEAAEKATQGRRDRGGDDQPSTDESTALRIALDAGANGARVLSCAQEKGDRNHRRKVAATDRTSDALITAVWVMLRAGECQFSSSSESSA